MVERSGKYDTRGYDKDTESRSASSGSAAGEMASRSLSATRLSSSRLCLCGRRKKTLGFASLPHGRFAFIGAITLERSEPFVQVGQTLL